MQVFDSSRIYAFMRYKMVYFTLSALLVLASIFCLATRGLNYGIDFAGGTLVQVKYTNANAPIEQIREALNANDITKGASVTEFGGKDEVVIRYTNTSDDVSSDPALFVGNLLKNTGSLEVRRVDVVGPKVGAELRQKGIMALSVSIVLILIYVAFRFEWRFGIAAIISQAHDIIIALGVISFLRLDVNLDTLAALLTILGYSLNDTIIVFDRIREGVTDSKSNDLNKNIDESISATLSRTFMTSVSTLLAVLTLFFFGGDMIHGFSIIMIVGIVVGTASSIFIAAPSLVWFGFDISRYRAHLADKQRKKAEKEKLRALYEKGSV